MNSDISIAAIGGMIGYKYTSHFIRAFQNKHLQKYLTAKNSGQISRLLKRLRTHGLIKRIRNSYKYYLTALGKQVILTALKIKELVIIPKLNDLKIA